MARRRDMKYVPVSAERSGRRSETRTSSAASPTALVVEVEVSKSATPGNRDITVVQGGGSPVAYRNVFQIVPLVSVAVSAVPTGTRG